MINMAQNIPIIVYNKFPEHNIINKQDAKAVQQKYKTWQQKK